MLRRPRRSKPWQEEQPSVYRLRPSATSAGELGVGAPASPGPGGSGDLPGALGPAVGAPPRCASGPGGGAARVAVVAEGAASAEVAAVGGAPPPPPAPSALGPSGLAN